MLLLLKHLYGWKKSENSQRNTSAWSKSVSMEQICRQKEYQIKLGGPIKSFYRYTKQVMWVDFFLKSRVGVEGGYSLFLGHEKQV